MTLWRSIHGSGPYEVTPIRIESPLNDMPTRVRTRLGIYESETEAVKRAIRDNQQLARKIKAQIATLKLRQAGLASSRPRAEDG